MFLVESKPGNNWWPLTCIRPAHTKDTAEALLEQYLAKKRLQSGGAAGKRRVLYRIAEYARQEVFEFVDHG